MTGNDSGSLLCHPWEVEGEMQVHGQIRSTNISSAVGFVNEVISLFISLHRPAKNGSYHVVLLVLKSTGYKSITTKPQTFPEPISAALGRFLFSCIKPSKCHWHCYDLAHLGYRCLTFLRRQNDCNVLKVKGMMLAPPTIGGTFEGTGIKRTANPLLLGPEGLMGAEIEQHCGIGWVHGDISCGHCNTTLLMLGSPEDGRG